VIPFPVDMTTTYMTGTRNGPRAILDASSHMELFDEENKIEPYRPDLRLHGGPDLPGGAGSCIEGSRATGEGHGAGRQGPVLLGGEHSGTVGRWSRCGRGTET